MCCRILGNQSRLPAGALLALFLGVLLIPSLPVAQTESDSLPVDSLAARPPLAPVTSLKAFDYKYDMGEQVKLTWEKSVNDDSTNANPVTAYLVYRIENSGDPVLISELVFGKDSLLDKSTHLDSTYQYYILTTSATDTVMSEVTPPLTTEWELLNYNRSFLFMFAAILTAAIWYYIRRAKRGDDLFIRKIAGLEAVDDAIGRATEMGRPILFIPGIHDMDDVQTLAALTILGRVAEHVADYDIQVRMPVARSLVMTAGRETIKAAYQTAGRPDAYNDDMVQYITDEQFGYVAAVDGIMVREKPATIFLLGAFFAESLILAETGNSVGAIQIAGTARPAQLPFFIAACDFTLIGEELFAASAYLSGEPKQLGSLKGQDVGKGIAMAAILLGACVATLHELFPTVHIFESVIDGLRYIFTPE